MNLPRLALLAMSAALPLSAAAHGYISAPESRGYQCKLGVNTNCGAIQWEPQSLEAPSGWPAGGPPDQHIASAGHDSFAELDVQTKTRWAKRKINAGQNNFTWTFTANHVTRNWRYYITKAGWSRAQKLTRASFESTPFCTVNGNMTQPPMQVTHSCNVPSRNGYHIILGVWEIGDTTNSFYNVLDVKFPAATSQAPD
jgi:chitin-binding protein